MKARAGRRRLLRAFDRVEFARSIDIEPDPWQRDLLDSDADRILLNCSRQSGKSTMAGIIALHRALYYPRSLVLILAPAERQAKETFSKVAEAYRRLGHETSAESYRKLGMELANGSRIEALPGTEKTIRGFSGTSLLILDEAARVDDGLYYAVRPMLAVSGGSLMMLSSPAGQRGVFFEAWMSDEPWERYEVTAHECPRIDGEFLAAEMRSLPHRIYRQEYECSFEEIEGAVFLHADIEAAFSNNLKPLFPDLDEAS